MAARCTFRTLSLRQQLVQTPSNFSVPIEIAILSVVQPWQCDPNKYSRQRILINTFSTTSAAQKKNTKATSKRSTAEPTSSSQDDNDPFDFFVLESGMAKIHEKLKNELAKLRTGGRFNPEVLEGLRVPLRHEDKTTIRLGDLAQVVPRGGRAIALMVGDKEHVKPIVSAIQNAQDLNLQPQQDPQNSSQLNIAIPPPTRESRDAALAAAGRAGETAKVEVRNARAAMQKRLRDMELKKSAREDDIRKASKDMEKKVITGVEDVKKIVEEARKSMAK